MSSDSLENASWSPRNPAERTLMALKMHGPLTATAIGEKLGISGEAARQQLIRLAKEDMVASSSSPSGVGRPSLNWELTVAGHARFPDTHAMLTVQILESVRTLLGEAALDTIIANREHETCTQYKAKVSQQKGLRERVATLADLRTAEGYMSEVQETADGSFLLVENHCPICAAATECQGFCRSELNIFKDVLGADADVERLEHVVNGGQRCSYRIRSNSR
mgnify:CR=1 FL=1